MTYSYTEKKRIRKDFSSTESIKEIPYLLETQINSYAKFLQSEIKSDDRGNFGLHAAFRQVFPIESYSGNARLEYVEYKLSPPVFNVKECQIRTRESNDGDFIAKKNYKKCLRTIKRAVSYTHLTLPTKRIV